MYHLNKLLFMRKTSYKKTTLILFSIKVPFLLELQWHIKKKSGNHQKGLLFKNFKLNFLFSIKICWRHYIISSKNKKETKYKKVCKAAFILEKICFLSFFLFFLTINIYLSKLHLKHWKKQNNNLFIFKEVTTSAKYWIDEIPKYIAKFVFSLYGLVPGGKVLPFFN